MANLLRNNPLTNFARGFFYPFNSTRFLLHHPALLKYVAIPFLINLVVFSSAVFLGFDFFNDVVIHYVPRGEAWYWAILYYFAWLVAVLVTAVVVFFSFTVVGNLVASPFNDLLSERTEEMLTGQKHDEPFSFAAFWKDTLRVVGVEVKKMGLFVLVMVMILPLNLLPGFGSIIYSVLAFVLTVFFLVVEYLGYVMARKRLDFRQQRRYVLGRLATLAGFGTGVLALLAIPFLQFFCIPVGVVGATRLWCDLESRDAPGGSSTPS
ncbi:sulfate transporter CysZ [Desulfuromonas versatilis]|uniref:Sulfate transporter CysZ n=1 Tax=Desulfuromonas versatilis TaxID=2802975 RepID=A0ABN6DXM3_9BACT|nr:sulfate transporter CysZ [Desulfuromonas versatilis]BCR04582.1 sulfate transporter CysZ [Desulfuromonas versatilis]